MKGSMLWSGAAALLAWPQLSLAQNATATIDVTGTVAGHCSVESGGTPGPTATGLIALGELSGADGRLAGLSLVTGLVPDYPRRL